MTDAAGIISAQSNPEFRIGLILRQSFETLGRGLWRYCVISLIPILPSLFNLLLSNERSRSAIWIALFLQVVLGLFVQGAIVYGAFQDMRGRPFSLGAALSRCLARIWPILGTSLLVSLIAGVGTLLLIVPGFIALLMLYVAVPACVVEGLGPAASLGRSAELTKGFRWKILGLILLVSLISIICSLLVTFIRLCLLELLSPRWGNSRSRPSPPR